MSGKEAVAITDANPPGPRTTGTPRPHAKPSLWEGQRLGPYNDPPPYVTCLSRGPRPDFGCREAPQGLISYCAPAHALAERGPIPAMQGGNRVCNSGLPRRRSLVPCLMGGVSMGEP